MSKGIRTRSESASISFMDIYFNNKPKCRKAGNTFISKLPGLEENLNLEHATV